jgi:hypothetical protein
MAAEAALRVREDGDTLAGVARDVGCPHEAWSGFLETADAGLRGRLLGAREGELLGPLREDGGFVLLHVLSRRAPESGDAAVRAHAEERVWGQVSARALDALRWEMTFSGAGRG